MSFPTFRGFLYILSKYMKKNQPDTFSMNPSFLKSIQSPSTPGIGCVSDESRLDESNISNIPD